MTESNINKLVSGTGRMNEEISDRPAYQQTGFSSLSKNGTQHIGIVNGNQIIIIASADTQDDRPVLSSAGDAVMYSSKTVYIKVNADESIKIDNGSGTIELKANGQVDINDGNLTVEP